VFRKKKKDEEETQGSSIPGVANHNLAKPAVTTGAVLEATRVPQPLAQECAEDVIGRRFGKPRSALGPGTVIQGKLSFDTVVIIDGKLGGEVYSSETLIVGKHGSVNAQVRVKHLVVAGAVSGNITATESIELLRGGRIDGDFIAKRLIIEEGAVFNGSCRMTGEAKDAQAAKAAASQKSAMATPNGTLSPDTSREGLRAEHAKPAQPEKATPTASGPTASGTVSAPAPEVAASA
jgi:cytoskeletal protein CcmA (bactofilin family)